MDIQMEAGIGSKLLSAIKAQRSKNKYILWSVYSVLAILLMFILYETFGFLIPNLSSSVENK